MAHGTWYVVPDTWHVVHGTWYMIRGTWYVVHGTWYLVHDKWYMVHGAWCMVHGTWCMVHGTWCMVIIIIVIIAFKGAIRNFLQSPQSAANRLQHVRSSGPGATVCKSRATHQALITCKCHVTCHLVRRDSSAVKFDRVAILFI